MDASKAGPPAPDKFKFDMIHMNDMRGSRRLSTMSTAAASHNTTPWPSDFSIVRPPEALAQFCTEPAELDVGTFHRSEEVSGAAWATPPLTEGPASRHNGHLRTAMVPVGEDSDEDLSAPPSRIATLTAEAAHLFEVSLRGQERTWDAGAYPGGITESAEGPPWGIASAVPPEAGARSPIPDVLEVLKANSGRDGGGLPQQGSDDKACGPGLPIPDVLEAELAVAPPDVHKRHASAPARTTIVGRSLGFLSARVCKAPQPQKPRCILTEKAEAYEAARLGADDQDFPPRHRLLSCQIGSSSIW